MKEFIEKLSQGKIEYEQPKAVADLENIEKTLCPEMMDEGSFWIENEGKGKLKGIIYSSHRQLRIKKQTFCENRVQIFYEIDTHFMEEGDSFQGEISIVSNGGELIIPFSIRIQSIVVHEEMGELKNLFHFANLVQQKYEQALKLFCSEDFPKIFLTGDLMLLTKYEGLIQGVDKHLALEEFLVAASKKKPVSLSVAKTEYSYRNLKDNFQDKIVLKKDSWGYVTADIVSEGEFLSLEKKKVEEGDFTGNTCQICFEIQEEKLREGYNFGQISIRTLRENIKISVSIYKNHENGIAVRGSTQLKCKQKQAELYRVYLDFRMKKIHMREWAETSLALISQMRKAGEESVFYTLLEAQILLAQNEYTKAQEKLEETAKILEQNGNRPVLEYAFYLYVSSIKEKRAAYTLECCEKIREFYQDTNDWRFLWILFYLDDNYERNESLKLTRMKEQFDNGMRSPLMYYETLAIFNASPSLLRILDDFETRVVEFGLKNRHISPLLAERITDLCKNGKKFQKNTFEVLKGLYQLFGRQDILESIVSLLIKSGKEDPYYFKWYEKAVNTGMKLTGLYEYYLNSIDLAYTEKLPDVILMYFAYNTTLQGERLDFLYKNILEHKDECEKIYALYKNNIEKYVVRSIEQGRINAQIAVIYQEVLREELVTEQLAQKLPELLNTYLVECDNPMVKEVIVIHKELSRQEHIPLMAGKAYIRMYSDDAAIVFGDVSGRRYLYTINYKLKKLLSMEKIQEYCYTVCPEHLGLLIHFIDQYFKYQKYRDDIVSATENLIKKEEIRASFRNVLENQMIDYYLSEGNENLLKEYLVNMNLDSLNAVTRAKILELEIQHGLYAAAKEQMLKYGWNKVNPLWLFRCVSKLLSVCEDDCDRDILELVLAGFRDGKYDEQMLFYLGTYYYGSTGEMYDIWTALKRFDCESRELEERLIVQMLFAGTYENRIGEVFESYLHNGVSEKVKKAYLIQKSYDYFVMENGIDEKLFSHIQRVLKNGEQCMDICILAYLKFKSQDRELTRDEAQLCANLIYEMCRKDKKFEFYKKFDQYFYLPQELEDKTILEYRSYPDSKVWIHYQIQEHDYDTGEKTYIVEEMKDNGYGIFTMEVILFYGEKLKYYIAEEHGGVRTVTQSMEGTQGREHIWNDSSVYGMLNNIMICSEMQEEETWKELTMNFYRKKQLNERLFQMK